MEARYLCSTSTDEILILSKSEKLGMCVGAYEPQMECYSEGIYSTKFFFTRKKFQIDHLNVYFKKLQRKD